MGQRRVALGKPRGLKHGVNTLWRPEKRSTDAKTADQLTDTTGLTRLRYVSGATLALLRSLGHVQWRWQTHTKLPIKGRSGTRKIEPSSFFYGRRLSILAVLVADT